MACPVQTHSSPRPLLARATSMWLQGLQAAPSILHWGCREKPGPNGTEAQGTHRWVNGVRPLCVGGIEREAKSTLGKLQDSGASEDSISDAADRSWTSEGDIVPSSSLLPSPTVPRTPREGSGTFLPSLLPSQTSAREGCGSPRDSNLSSVPHPQHVRACVCTLTHTHALSKTRDQGLPPPHVHGHTILTWASD